MNIVKLLLLLTYLLSAQTNNMSRERPYINFQTLKASNDLLQNINAGFSNTTGNTNNLDANIKYDFSVSSNAYKNHLLKIAFDTSIFYTETEKKKSNEEYLLNLGLEQDLGKQWLSYLALNWLRNPEFKNYNHKLSLGLGFGKDIFFDGKRSLTIKLGTAHNLEDYANHQETKSFSSFNEYLEYKNQLNRISKLYFRAGALQHFEGFEKNYELLGILGVNFKVGDKISLNLEQELMYDNLPPLGFKKSDTKSIVRLGYTF